MKRNIHAPTLAATALLALTALAATAYSQTDTTPAIPLGTPAAAAPASPDGKAAPNETARFLAGLPVEPGTTLGPLAAEKAWDEHAKFFNTAWDELNKSQLAKARTWASTYIPGPSASNSPVFYMFSGPDYLYVNTFYPNASTYVFCGIEPVGSMPDITKIKPAMLEPELQDLQKSLNSVLSFSFFITKDMKNDLQDHEIKGTLPLILIFIARAGNTVTDVSYVGIDSDGKVQPVDDPAKSHLIPGAKITFTQPNAAQPQVVYYFDTDISDDGIKKTPGFLKYCQSLAPGNSFVKSASYLMHEAYFSTIRNFLLKNSLTLVQDDSGIPITYFTANQWTLRYFGSYPGPIDLFKKYVQPDLTALYQKSHPVALDFRFGYRHYAAQSTLIVATHKSADAPAPDANPAPSPKPAASATPAASTKASTPSPDSQPQHGYVF